MRTLLLVIITLVVYAQDQTSESSQGSVQFDDPQLDLTKRITSCWLMALREIQGAQTQMNEVLNFTKTLGFNNRTQVYYKIQLDMISRCYELINLEQANNILLNLQDPTQLTQKFSDIVQDFNFTDYIDELLDFNLDEHDEALLRVVKQLEGELYQYKEKKTAKTNETNKKLDQQKRQAIKNWQEALMKSAKNREQSSQDVKPKGSSFIVDFKPAWGSYIFFAIFVGGFVLGGLWVFKTLSKMDQTEKKKKTKKTKQQ